MPKISSEQRFIKRIELKCKLPVREMKIKSSDVSRFIALKLIDFESELESLNEENKKSKSSELNLIAKIKAIKMIIVKIYKLFESVPKDNSEFSNYRAKRIFFEFLNLEKEKNLLLQQRKSEKQNDLEDKYDDNLFKTLGILFLSDTKKAEQLINKIILLATRLHNINDVRSIYLFQNLNDAIKHSNLSYSIKQNYFEFIIRKLFFLKEYDLALSFVNNILNEVKKIELTNMIVNVAKRMQERQMI